MTQKKIKNSPFYKMYKNKTIISKIETLYKKN